MSLSRRLSEQHDGDQVLDDVDQPLNASTDAFSAFLASLGGAGSPSSPLFASTGLSEEAPLPTLPWQGGDDLFGGDPSTFDPAIFAGLFDPSPTPPEEEPIGREEDLLVNGPVSGHKRRDRSGFDAQEARKKPRGTLSSDPPSPSPLLPDGMFGPPEAASSQVVAPVAAPSTAPPSFTPAQLLPGRDLIPLKRPTRPGLSPPESPILSPLLKLQPPRSQQAAPSASGQALPWSRAPSSSFSGPSVSQPGAQTVALPSWPTPKAKESIEASSQTRFKGAPPSGFYPDGISEDYALPAEANYQGQYSSQILSQLSYVSRGALDLEQLNPVEVQYGYGLKKSGALELFASTNNLVTQTALAERLQDPEAMVRQVAGSTRASYAGDRRGFSPSISNKDAETRAGYADRLLAFDKLDARRREEIQAALLKGEIDADQAAARQSDLDLTRQIFSQFASGQVTVVKNPPKGGPRSPTPDGPTALAGARATVATNNATWNAEMDRYVAAQSDPTVTEKPGAPSKSSLGNKLKDPKMWPDRHAEQNISDALHARNEDPSNTDPFVAADIHGTMCRCAACAAELGQNTLDTDGLPVSGRIWVAQGNKDGLSKISEDSFAGRNHMLPNSKAADPPLPDSPLPFYEPPVEERAGTWV